MSNLEKSIKKEIELFNLINAERQNSDFIPVEFDYDLNPIKFDFDRYVSKKMGQKSVSILIDLVNSIKKPTIIDVCCGPGWVSLLSARRGANVFGYDITDIGIKNANLNKERNINFIL